MTDSMIALTEADFAGGRWEPCHAYAPEVVDSQVCGACGWLHDDHIRDAEIHEFPARKPKPSRPRRLAS
jgi:hypothetical protein